MKSAVSIIEILGTIHDGTVEVCASADADFDAHTKKIVVTLDAYTRPVTKEHRDEHRPQAWLPCGEDVTEHLPREDAGSFAREVFATWVRKVRASVPGELMLRA